MLVLIIINHKFYLSRIFDYFMNDIVTRNSKVERKLHDYIYSRGDIFDKLERLKLNPRKECGAHPLHGRLKGK